MRAVLIATLVAACGGRAAPPEPPRNDAAGTPVAVDTTKLGGLVLIPFVGESNPTFAPTSEVFAFDTNNLAKPGTAWRLIASDGKLSLVNASETSTLPYGCDNSLEGTVLAPKEAGSRLPAGVAWMMPADATWHPTAIRIEPGAHEKTRESYRVGALTVKLAKVARSKGIASVEVAGQSAELESFERVIMEGAEPSLEDLDLSDPEFKLQIPVPVAAWAIAANGPYVVVMHTQGFEGATLETYLVEGAPTRATKIEPMTVYLYQCAF